MQIDENTLHEILNEVDLNKNGQVELNEFLQVRAAPAARKGRATPGESSPCLGWLGDKGSVTCGVGAQSHPQAACKFFFWGFFS